MDRVRRQARLARHSSSGSSRFHDRSPGATTDQESRSRTSFRSRRWRWSMRSIAMTPTVGARSRPSRSRRSAASSTSFPRPHLDGATAARRPRAGVAGRCGAHPLWQKLDRSPTTSELATAIGVSDELRCAPSIGDSAAGDPTDRARACRAFEPPRSNGCTRSHNAPSTRGLAIAADFAAACHTLRFVRPSKRTERNGFAVSSAAVDGGLLNPIPIRPGSRPTQSR
jgi:hypothetical protein